VRLGVLSVVVAVAGGTPVLAIAADGESALSITAGVATFTVSQATDVSGTGAALGVDYTRSVADALWLRAAIGGGVYCAAGARTMGGTAVVGVYYAVDVLRYVPYATAGVGVFYAGGGAVDAKARLVLEVGAGVEIGEGRSFSWGIDARLGSFASGATTFTIGPRFSFKFGYF
jgi:hypothetical protein